MVCPCRDCENKGCGAYHDICEKYQDYKRYINRSKSNKLKSDEIRHTINSSIKRMRKAKRSKGCVLRGDMQI